MVDHVLKFGQIRSRDFGVRGVHITPNFQRSLAAKRCIGGKHVLEVQERYGPPLSPCQVWWGSDVLFCFFYLSVTLLSGKVCERHLAINALEYGNDLGSMKKCN